MIKQLNPSDFSLAAKVIRASFATVAKEFGLTEENCPTHTSFSTTTEKLRKNQSWGWLMYGFFDGGNLAGHVAISKEYVPDSREATTVYEIHNLAILPEYRHKGYGKQLLEFSKNKVKELGGSKITIGIIEENTVLKNWYAANGFIHTGTKRFEQFPFTVGFMELAIK
ncbi:MAG: GNAT family N-acetyltransferase [Oscillospiraceae bacterium]|nr:GNAT family N-acetyltransferase [Oscillospiraceae bacterium]